MALIRAFWHGGALSPYEVLCLTSFVHHGHATELYSYDSGLTVPPGVVLRDAAEVLPSSRIYFYANGLGAGSIAGFTNLFRYTLLARSPGWWVDCDVICLRPDLPEAPVFCAWEGPDHALVGNAILKLPPDDPLLAAMLADKDAFDPGQSWGTSGPWLLTKALRAAGRLAEVQEWPAAYPWHFTRAFDVFDPAEAESVARAAQGAAFQHLWNEMFNCAGMNKLLAPPEGSYLDRLCREHGVAFPSTLRLRPKDLHRQARATHAAQQWEHAQAELARLRDLLAQAEAGQARLLGLLEKFEALAMAERHETARWRKAHQSEVRLRQAATALHDAVEARLEVAEAPIWRRWLRLGRA